MWPNPQETADFVRFTEEIFDGKLQFLWSIISAFFLVPENLTFTWKLQYREAYLVRSLLARAFLATTQLLQYLS